MGELDDDDRRDLIALLKEAIARDRYPLSPRVRRWMRIVAKLEPPAPRPMPLPPPRPAGTPSLVQRKLKGGRRR
jgi:hypothetical protein